MHCAVPSWWRDVTGFGTPSAACDGSQAAIVSCMKERHVNRSKMPDVKDGGAGSHPSGSRMRTVFFDAAGLRWFWGCVVFLLLFSVLSPASTAMRRALVHGPQPHGMLLPAGLVLPAEITTALTVLLVTFLAARAEGRPFGAFGLADRAWLPRLAWGSLAGFGAICGLVAFLWSQHLLVLSGTGLSIKAALGYGSVWAVVFFLVALTEEALLRGYLLFTLARGIGWFWSSVLLSLAFSAIHFPNNGENLLGLVAVAMVGLVDSLSVYYTRSLWWVLGFHAAWDWGESFFWGTANSGRLVQGYLMGEHPIGPAALSGGTAGPEGSLYNFAVLFLSALLMFLWWRKRAPHGA